MRKYLFVLSIVVLNSCDAGKKDSSRTATPSDTSTKADEQKDTTTNAPAGKIDIESFGPVKIGQPSAETIKALGEPDMKSKVEEWGADGLLHEDWTWKDKGLVLNMSSEKENVSGSKTVFSIIAIAPCNFTTRAGIGIGGTYEAIQTAYKRDINPEESSQEQVTVGSIYGGILFTLKEGKVTRIFLGAAAE